MNKSGLRNRLRSGLTFNFIATAFNRGSTFLVNVILSNLLGRFGFGEYSMIQATLTPLGLMSQLATGYTATKYVAEHRSTDKLRTGRILGLLSTVSAVGAGLVGLGLFMLSPWIATHALNAPQLASALRLGSGVVLFAALSVFQIGALAGLEGYPSLAKAGIGSGVLYLALCSTLAWRWGVNGAVAGLLVSALAQWLIQRYYLAAEQRRHGILTSYEAMATERDIIFRFAMPAAAAGLYTTPAIWLANTFLVRQPDGYIQMALYSAGYTIRILVLFVPNIVNTVGLSILNHTKGVGNAGQYRKTLGVNVALMATAALVAALAATAFGKLILQAFGRNFSAAYPVLVMLVMAAIPESLTLGLYQHVQAQGRMWLSLLAIVIPRETTLVVGSFLLTPEYGARGLAASYLAASVVGLACTAGTTALMNRSPRAKESLGAPSELN